MKQIRYWLLGSCLIFTVSFETSAQDPTDKKSKKEVAVEVAGKAAVEVGKASGKLVLIAAKATCQHVVVPTAKLLWNPVLTKAAPKVLGETAKLMGKGIKKGFKLIFKRDRTNSPDAEGN